TCTDCDAGGPARITKAPAGHRNAANDNVGCWVDPNYGSVSGRGHPDGIRSDRDATTVVSTPSADVDVLDPGLHGTRNGIDSDDFTRRGVDADPDRPETECDRPGCASAGAGAAHRGFGHPGGLPHLAVDGIDRSDAPIHRIRRPGGAAAGRD